MTCVMGSSGVPSGVCLPMMRGRVVRSLGAAQSSSLHMMLVEWFPGCPPGMSHRWLLVLYAQHWRMPVIFLLSV